jgi:GT2 family glycosyltransferase
MTQAHRDLDGKLAIVIPVHNRCEFTRACLASLSRQTVSNFAVIVVDDGSTDGTAEMIRSEFPDTVVLTGDGNLWWTGATNLGVKLALERGAASVMTLNDDTLPGPAFVETMRSAAAANPGALIGAFAVEAATGRPVFGGARMNWVTASSQDLLDPPVGGRLGLVEVTHFPGRGLLIPSQVFRRIGLFDAFHFPHYIADYDFTCRARRNGFKIYCNRDAALGVYLEASGDAENRRRKDLRHYYRHLFHIKGGANLKAYFWFSLRNCPKALLPISLPVGLIRRIVGYPLEAIGEICADCRQRYALYRRA